MEAAQASTALSGTFRGGHSLQSVNHIAHLSGALVGVVLVWLLSKVPSQSPDGDVSTSHRGKDRTL
jgi:membrane associated rhomboid family serine protease